MIPEFVGRLPVISSLQPLDEAGLVRVLTEPKNALVKQYQKLFAMETADFSFTEEALRAIARRALEKDTGARGLRSIIEEVMLDVMFDLPENAGRPLCGHTRRRRRAANGCTRSSKRKRTARNVQSVDPAPPSGVQPSGSSYTLQPQRARNRFRSVPGSWYFVVISRFCQSSQHFNAPFDRLIGSGVRKPKVRVGSMKIFPGMMSSSFAMARSTNSVPVPCGAFGKT